MTSQVRSGLIGASLTVVCGLALWQFPIGEPLVRLSYDLPFIFSPKVNCDQVLIIKMDEQSYHETNQKWGAPWDRARHARLLQKLKADQSGVVVFDVWFPDEERQAADLELSEAIRSHGQVVLPAV